MDDSIGYAQNNDDSNSNSCSLIRIKSEHNLKENKDSKSNADKSGKAKDKSYNSKNFFTENFDDQEMEDAINKIKSNPDFDSPSAEKSNESRPSNQLEDQNIELYPDEQSISFDESNLKDLSNDPIRVAEIIDSANVDYQKLCKNTFDASHPRTGAILVDDDQNSRDELNEESSWSDHLDLGKTVDLKKEGFYDKLRNDKDIKKEKNNLFMELEKTKDHNSSTELTQDKNSKSSDNLKSSKDYLNVSQPAGISIERIGSPNKPKHEDNQQKLQIKELLKDTRHKIDDEDEEEIITGSHTVNTSGNSSAKQQKKYKKADSMVDFIKQTQNYKSDDDRDRGDMKNLLDEIIVSLIKDLDHQLFPQRPLFLLTADLKDYTLDQIMMFLREITPEKEAILIESIRKQKSRKKKESKIVLFERKGIQTDLIATEDYILSMHKFISAKMKKKFLKQAFTSIKKDPLELLNQLQNSDIGSYEHFEIDYSSSSVLEDRIFQVHDKFKKTWEIEEQKDKDTLSPSNTISDEKSSIIVKFTKRKRKPIEFDQSGLSEEEIEQKMKIFKACERVHNKALFDGINEVLTDLRPYGPGGEPPPWSNKNRNIQKKPAKEKFNMDKIFNTIRNSMFKWGVMQAGTLPRKDFIFGGTFDEELFNEIREKKLATLLATEVIENEHKWLNYDFEEAQVRIDLGDMILEQLVSESIAILNVIDSTGREKSIYTEQELVDQLVVNESYYNKDYYDEYDDDDDYVYHEY